MSILCYHAVDDAWTSRLVVTPRDFEAHCAWLARNRTVIAATAAAETLTRRGALPRGTTAITFDDGFASLYDHALPILRRHSIPATVFLVAATLSEGKQVDWVDDAPRIPPTTLTRDQILEMQDAGITFGSHSYSHADLTRLGQRECVDDLTTSRTFLEELLGRPVDLLAYPRGRNNEVVRRASARAGYRYAFSLPEAPEPVTPYSIPRAGVFPDNGIRTLRAKTARWYLPVRKSKAFPVARAAIKGRRPPTRPAS